MALQKGLENTVYRICEQRGQFQSVKKETDEIPGTHREERELDKFDTHRTFSNKSYRVKY